MPPFHPMTDPPHLTPGERLQHLRRTLDGLSSQLREGISRAVAQIVADTIRQAVGSFLGGPVGGNPFPSPYRQLSGNLTSPWGSPRPSRWDDDIEEELREEEDVSAWRPRSGPLSPTPVVGGGDAHTPVRLGRALASGCQAAAWWLRRHRDERSLMAALAVGLTTTLAVLAGGRLATGVGLAGAALGLLTVADAARDSARLLSENPGP